MEQDIRQAVEKWIADEWFSHNKDEHDDFVNFVAARVTENGCSEHPETYLNKVDIEDEYEAFREEYDDPRLTKRQKRELGYE